MTRAYQEDLASRVSAVSYAGILWGAGAGLFIFDETYAMLQYVGMGMVIAGVVLNINAERMKVWYYN
jgi:drug/metabolite transporter (DMT)-like permease